MRIEGVTITGADDKVDRSALYELSDRFPFVEWGILDYPEKSGKNRYPSDEWMEKFDRYAPDFVRKSIHLYGSSASDFCSGDLSIVRYSAYGDPRYDRIQVNVLESGTNGILYRYSDVADLFIRSNKVLPTIIQKNKITEPIIEQLMKKEDGNWVNFLVDESRGKGIYTDIAPNDKKLYNLLRVSRCGFAGGINPENVVDIIKKISDVSNSHYCIRSIIDGKKMCPPSTWIDMESGVRTNNEFDLNKVEDVLAKVEKFISGW